MAKNNKASQAQDLSKIFPLGFRVLFIVLEPLIIWISLASITIVPANFFISLAPNSSNGPFFDRQPELFFCDQATAWNTPQLRTLTYMFMSALAFSAVIEPVVLALAVYGLHDVRDSQAVITAVLLSFAIFDGFHSFATIAVTGSHAVIPSPGLDFSSLDFYAMINFWVPLAWMSVRAVWLLRFRRPSGSIKEE